MNLQIEIARIDQRRSELHEFIDEQHKATKRDRLLWLFPVTGMIIGAAIFIAGMAFGRLL